MPRLPTFALLAIALLVSACATSQPPPAAAATGASTAASAPTSAESAKLHALFARHWTWIGETFPEWGTFRGDHRFGDRLTDNSPAGRAAQDTATQRWLAEARAIDRAQLASATDRTSLDLFIVNHERRIEFLPFTGYRSLAIGSNDGAQTALAGLLSVTPMDSRERVEQLLVRLAAVPRATDHAITQMRGGAALGWAPTRETLDRALAQIDRQLAPALEDGPFYAPFKRLPAGMPEAERRELQERGRAAVAQQVLPAMRQLRAFVADEYRAKAVASGAYADYPGGARVYELLVRNQTTTALSARQIHDIGLAELARLRGEMDAVLKQAKFEGDFAAFIRFLDTDTRFAYPNADALLAHYRDIGKRLDAELPRLFAELPRTTWGVRPMPPHMAADRAEYYENPARDGSRPGWFFANAKGFARKRTWEAETLVAHEAVPGHHLQIARGLEMRELPEFRRGGFHTAYVEGWALYAETLGFELGLYTDPYNRFGHLQWQAFRAARLVVDTGLHAFGWSRQRAIDTMVERTGVGREFVASEVDRYLSNPGQALAYMIGKLKFDELRERAKAKLGARFDVRRFHNMLLDQGALPLDVLERLADEWIATEAAR
jgi:uncharacterized protein (DUF885 family)